MNENFSQNDLDNGFYPLRPFQKWILDRNFNKAKSIMFNVGTFFKISSELDPDRLVDAVNQVFHRHDIFRQRFVFHPETNNLCQRFDGEILPVQVESWSDEEFNFIKRTVNEPYLLIDKPMYKFFCFKTPSQNYFLADAHHAIIDGTAIVLLMIHEVNMIYQGKKVKPAAQFADLIAEEMKIPPEILTMERNYWRDILKNFDTGKYLPPPDISGKYLWKKGSFGCEFKNITPKFFRESGNKETFFFMAASMFALAKSNNQKKSLLTVIHNGRTTQREMRIFGLMIEQMPLGLDFSKNLSLAEILQLLEKNFEDGLKNRGGLDYVYDGGFEENLASFMFQKKNFSYQDYFVVDGQKCEVEESTNNFWAAAQNTLDIEITLLESGKYSLILDYDAGIYSESAIRNFAELTDEIILKMQGENIFSDDLLN